jgi:enterochelin esterase-like enzyme
VSLGGRNGRLLLIALVVGGVTAGLLAARPGHGHGRIPRGGTTSFESFYSTSLHGKDHYAICLPPGYYRTRRRYPVIYFLHGLPERPGAYRNIGPVAQAVERSGHQAIVVGAQGARANDTDPEWLDHGPGENWETATAVELVNTIDRRYRTIPAREGRLLIGISGGGYGAMLIGSHHPGTYSVIESWSGYFHATNPAGTAPLDLGSEPANDWANFHKQIPALKMRYGPLLDSTWFNFYVGTNDSRFRAENMQTFMEMRSQHIPHVLFRLYRGGHSWSLWQPHAVDWVRTGLREAARSR